MQQAAVGGNLRQLRAVVGHEAQRRCLGEFLALGRLVGEADKIVVEVRRPHRQLRLLHGQPRMVVPRHLLRRDQRQPPNLGFLRIGGAGLAPGAQEIGAEQARFHGLGLERDVAAQDLRAVVAGHADRCDLARAGVREEFDGSGHVHRAVRHVHRLVGERAELAQELVVDGDHLVRLPAGLRDASRERDVGAVAIAAAEGVAGQRAGVVAAAGHDHAAVQAARERHADPRAALEVSAHHLRKHFAQAFVELGFAERRDVLERLDVEIGLLPREAAPREDPARRGRQQRHAGEQRAALQRAAAGDELGQRLVVDPARGRDGAQDGLGLAREVQRVLAFVDVDSPEPEPVGEEDGQVLPQVDEQAAEGAVELVDERRSEGLVQLDEVAAVFNGALARAVQRRDARRVGELLARQEQADVPRRVPDRVGVGEQARVHGPAGRDAGALVMHGAGSIERFVPHGVDHPLDGGDARERFVRTDDSRDSRHVESACVIGKGGLRRLRIRLRRRRPAWRRRGPGAPRRPCGTAIRSIWRAYPRA